MRKTRYFPYVLLIFFLFSILSISKEQTLKIRSFAVSCVSPFWGNINSYMLVLGSLMPSLSSKSVKASRNDIFHDIELENALLKDQIDSVYKWLMFDQRIDSQLEALKEVRSRNVDDLYWKDFFRRRGEDLQKILEVELQALPAKIIFREPSSWSSSVWINVGEKDNDDLGRLIIGKDSPVVVGDSLVGIVEYVGKNESRVRLITDSGLIPSVRAVRGSTQDKELLQGCADLFDRIYSREDLFDNEDEKEIFHDLLSGLIKKLKNSNVDYYLAKGELHGNSYPLWRSYGQKIKGVGFNYDYSDLEGPDRELRTGRALDKKFDFLSQALLKKGDLLVTTGMDGVFPAGLKVAIVSNIKNIEEGDYSYDIEATPTAYGLSNLNIVFVMPPLGFESD